jgi:hypothetical protein
MSGSFHRARRVEGYIAVGAGTPAGTSLRPPGRNDIHLPHVAQQEGLPEGNLHIEFEQAIQGSPAVDLA